MSTALNNPVEISAGTSNGVGFPDTGTGITLGLIALEEYDQTDFDTGEAKTWSDGKPMKGLLIKGLAWKVDGIEIGPKDAKVTPEQLDEVSIWVEGSKYFAWRDATKAAAAADHRYEVGDLVWFACVSTEAAKNPRHNARKVYEAKIAKPTAEHSALVAACEAAHRKDSAIPVDAPSADPFA